ncbi:hypothetical protein RP20_CCG010931 [Aedes albopictus]|nr:hypothetical protein RP20_CCG010931 [Aedes albopictus]
MRENIMPYQLAEQMYQIGELAFVLRRAMFVQSGSIVVQKFHQDVLENGQSPSRATSGYDRVLVVRRVCIIASFVLVRCKDVVLTLIQQPSNGHCTVFSPALPRHGPFAEDFDDRFILLGTIIQ